MVGAFGGPIGALIGGAVGGIIGGGLGAIGAESIFEGISGNPEDEIRTAIQDATIKVMERSMAMAQMDEGTFDQLANENLAKQAATGGDAKGLETAFRDARKKS
jgi:hypothetical protein